MLSLASGSKHCLNWFVLLQGSSWGIEGVLLSERCPRRAGDFICRKQPGCDLVKHWLEEVIISLVDQRHTDWSFAQSADGLESSETTTDNDYMRQHQRHPGSGKGIMKSIVLEQ